MAAIRRDARAGTPSMTIEQVRALPDDGHRYDVIDGELLRMSPAGRRHARVEMNIGWRLAEHVQQHDLGEVYGADIGFVLSRTPLRMLSPDVSFVRRERLPVVAHPDDEDDYLELAPDFAVEVVSPSNTAREMTDKVMAYLETGTQLVWIVEPRRPIVTAHTSDLTAQIHRDDTTLDAGDVLPGFLLHVADIFA
jgi:Uma2 family endonuclease